MGDASMEMPQHLKNPIDTSDFHQRLYEYYKNGQYSDVTIVVEGKEYQCHKVILAAWSEYFATMFSSSYVESHKNKIELHDVSHEGFEAILKFCYSRESTITTENVCDIYQIAHYLSFKTIHFRCLMFMNEFSELKYLYLAIQKNDKDFVTLMLANVAHTFSSIWKTSEFNECPQSELEELLSHRHLMVDSEYEVFQALMKWVDSNPVPIEEKLKLMRYVRFHLFSPEEWQLLLQSDFCKDFECLKYLTRLIPYGSDRYGRPLMVQEKQNEPRGCSSILMVKHNLNYGKIKILPIETFSSVEALSVKRPPLPGSNCRTYCTGITINNFLYILDGNSCDFFRYCPLENEWIDLSKMRQKRKYFSATAMDSAIYVFGGMDGEEETVRDIDQYDIKTNKWSKLAGLGEDIPRTIKAATVGGEIYVLYNKTIGIFNKVSGKCQEIAKSSLDSKSCAAVVAGNLIYFAGHGQAVERFDTTTRSITAVYKYSSMKSQTDSDMSDDDDDSDDEDSDEGSHFQGVYSEDIHSGEKMIYMLGDVAMPGHYPRVARRALYKITLNDDAKTNSVPDILTKGYSGMGIVILKSRCRLFSDT